MPFAPGRFSTIIGWPSDSDSLPPICRARMSGELPGGAGTRMRMGLEGKDCPSNVDGSAHAKIAPITSFFMMDRPPSSSNFIRQVIEADLAGGKHKEVVT